MSKKYKFFIPILAFSALLPTCLLSSKGFTSTKAEDVTEKVQLRIKNMADYIYIDEKDSANDLIHQFERWCATNTKYKNVEVLYSTTDTNETLLTEMQTGKSSYDLVCPSDYMIQKMIVQDLIEPLDREDRDTLLANYDTYASKYVRNRLDSMSAKTIEGSTVTLGDYAVGYMWGTLGILFNPTYNDTYIANSINDASLYSAFYDTKYSGTMSIKDSVRDTFAMSLMHVYQDELLGYRIDYLDPSKPEYGDEEYHADIQKVFDRNGGPNDDIPGTLEKVSADLDSLKGNIFGLEVDSGKSDIVQKRIGMNLAWSGDAVYSMDLGEDENTFLDYAVPLNGTNIWFDAWVMPKCSRTSYQEEVAYMFLDFISTPENAAQNMDYTGYTSFIGGEEILTLVREWYDARIDEETGEFDPTIVPEPGVVWQTVDLNYFFNKDFSTDPSFVPNEEYIFKTEEYFVSTTGGEYSECVGRQFFCQYPDYKTIVRCAVMKDYGDQYSAILKVWEKFKSNSLPLWAIILFIVEICLIVVALAYWIISKNLNKRLRKLHKKES